MHSIVKIIFSVAFGIVCGFVVQHHSRIDEIESYLTHSHGYDASKELGFYKPFDEKEIKQ